MHCELNICFYCCYIFDQVSETHIYEEPLFCMVPSYHTHPNRLFSDLLFKIWPVKRDIFHFCTLRDGEVLASWWQKKNCRCVGDPDEWWSWKIAMKMDADPLVWWGHLLPPRPAGEPSGNPSPEPWNRKWDGKKMQSSKRVQMTK